MTKKNSNLAVLVAVTAAGTFLGLGRADALPFLESVKSRLKEQVQVTKPVREELGLVKQIGQADTGQKDPFCSKFSDSADELAKRIGDVQSKLHDRQQNRDEDWTARWDNQDAKLGTLRTEQDARREEWYAKLEAGNPTDSQQKAIETFRETVDSAVDDRRSSVDDANKAFREAVGKLSDTRQSAVDGLSNDFQSAVDAAVAAAKKGCDDGKDAKTIRTDFRAAIDAARKTLQNGRDKRIGIGTDVSALAKTRDVAIRKAMDTFKSALAAATSELKKAFPSGE